MRDRKKACRFFAGKPEEKCPLGRSIRTWDYNINIGLKEIEWDGVEWTGLIWRRTGTAAGRKEGGKPAGYIKFGEFLGQLRK
jgi:hypothetical protein